MCVYVNHTVSYHINGRRIAQTIGVISTATISHDYLLNNHHWRYSALAVPTVGQGLHIVSSLEEQVHVHWEFVLPTVRRLQCLLLRVSACESPSGPRNCLFPLFPSVCLLSFFVCVVFLISRSLSRASLTFCFPSPSLLARPLRLSRRRANAGGNDRKLGRNV